MRFIWVIFCLPWIVHAQIFQKIYQGYQVSDRLKEIQMHESLSHLDFLVGENQFDWKLGFNTAFRDSFLEALFAFQGQKTVTQTYGFSLVKNSYKFGSINLAHTITEYDISNWNSSSLNSFSSDKIFEAKNTINYSYEFLNKSSALDWEVVHIQNLANKTSDKIRADKDHYDFFNAYLQAKHKIILDRLYREFEQRAVKRVNQISRRVRDGLSRRVDLDQARLSQMTQRETIIRNLGELRQAVVTIEDIIKTPIPEADYKKLSWSFKASDKTYPYLKADAYFSELESLEKQNQLAQINVQKQDELAGHSLSLNMGYTKNSFDESSNQAFQDAVGASARDEKTISLNYIIPLGLSKRDAIKQKLTLQRNQSLLKLKNREGELRVRHKVLLENLKRYEDAVELTKKKITVASRVVRENKKLYLRGQILFEESLRAEEALINTRIAHANMLLAHENTMAELAFLMGKISAFLRDYRD